MGKDIFGKRVTDALNGSNYMFDSFEVVSEDFRHDEKINIVEVNVRLQGDIVASVEFVENLEKHRTSMNRHIEGTNKTETIRSFVGTLSKY